MIIWFWFWFISTSFLLRSSVNSAFHSFIHTLRCGTVVICEWEEKKFLNPTRPMSTKEVSYFNLKTIDSSQPVIILLTLSFVGSSFCVVFVGYFVVNTLTGSLRFVSTHHQQQQWVSQSVILNQLSSKLT